MSKRPIKSLKGTRMELIKKIQINKTKTPSSLFRLPEKRAVGVEIGFKERKSDLSLDFSAFGPSKQEAKLFYATRATRGIDFVEFRQL